MAPEFFTDWSIDYVEGPVVHRRLTLVDHSAKWPYSAVTEVEMTGNEIASSMHREYVEAGLEAWSERLIIEALATAISADMVIVLDDHMPRSFTVHIAESRYGADYNVVIKSRLLGTDTGADVVLRLGWQLLNIIDQKRRSIRPPTETELAKVAELRRKRGA